jgi:hypothetical protein
MTIKFVNPENPDEVIEIPESFKASVEKVDGETKDWTLDEIINQSRQNFVATQRFQEASNLKKEADEKMAQYEKLAKMQELSQKATDGDVDAFEELARMMDYPEEEIERLKEQYLNPEPENDNQDTQDTNQGDDDVPDNNTPNDETVTVSKAQWQQMYSAVQELSGKEVKSDLKKALDNDPNLGRLTDGQKDQVIDRFLMQDMMNQMESGQPYSPQMLTQALETAKASLKDLGSLPETAEEESKAKKDAENKEKLAQIETSLGSVPLNIKEVVEKGEIPERVPMTDPNYEKQTMQRLAAKRVQSSDLTN